MGYIALAFGSFLKILMHVHVTQRIHVYLLESAQTFYTEKNVMIIGDDFTEKTMSYKFFNAHTCTLN